MSTHPQRRPAGVDGGLDPPARSPRRARRRGGSLPVGRSIACVTTDPRRVSLSVAPGGQSAAPSEKEGGHIPFSPLGSS
jgi:hypothetical protein